jgi:tetratricopeptide (TPR) repeat protein
MLVDSRECERLAALGLVQSDHLDAAYYGLARVEDMRARAWSTIGEARRIRSDLHGAEAAFAQAHTHLAAGTGDSLEWAFLVDGEAALRRRQRRFAEARELLLRAIETFVENGEDQRVGRSLVSLAAVYRDEPRRSSSTRVPGSSPRVRPSRRRWWRASWRPIRRAPSP